MTTSTGVWIVIVVVVAAGMAGVGYVAGYELHSAPASCSASVAGTLSILGAGTLNTIFPALADQFQNQTPCVSAPPAAQTYEGSIDITTAITSGTAVADVAAVADYRLVPQMLEPKFANFEIVFGSTQEVLAYNPSLPAFSGINSTNWPTKLLAATSTAPLGIWNASTDPNGYNEIFSMMLQGMLYDGGNVSAVYSHFYTGAPGAYAVGIPATTKLEHESQAANLVATGVVSAVITYRSYAIVNHMTYVPFTPIVGLDANNTTALADYAMLSTSIIGSSGGLVKVVPAPVLFSVTVPLNAWNPTLGAGFIELLLSPKGGSILSQGGAFTPISPGWTDDMANVPAALAPDVVPLPAWAATILG
ncbi:MAG TPA: substrate-binding domain-containing protein [Thermoplasmata archaeon]|nr:substrate-binding domain-containing protein [Thermoplasmata archaeon]